MQSKTWNHIVAIGVVVGIVGFVFSLFTALSTPTWFEKNKVLVTTHCLHAVLTIFLLYLYVEKPKVVGLPLPKVRLVRENGQILTENVNWLSVGTLCAVYLKEGEFEVLQCQGRVINIQQNGLVQLETEAFGNEALITELSKNRENILVKPGVNI